MWSDQNKNLLFKPHPLTHRKVALDSHLPISSLLLTWPSLVIATFAFVCYFNSLWGNFVFDDSEAIINNPDVKLETPLVNVFKNDFWGTRLTLNSSHKSYRPLTVILFRLNHYLSGGLYPFKYHLVNLLLYCKVCILAHHVISHLFTVSLGAMPYASLLCALLFTIHPIHTENVAAIVGCADLLCSVFFFLSLLAYFRAFSSCPHVGLGWLFLSIVLAGISMLCKEPGLTVLGICCMYELIYGGLTPRPKSVSVHQRFHPQNGLKSFWRILMLGLGGGLLLWIRFLVMGSTPPKFQPEDNPASFLPSIWLRGLNYQYLYSLNAWLLLHPLWLCFDWSMGCIPTIQSFFDARVIPVVVFWVFLIALSVYSLRTLNKLVMIALALLIVPFLPASNLFFRVGFVIAERALFLPSLGFCLLVTYGLVLLFERYSFNAGVRQMLQFSMWFLLLVFLVRSVQRNTDWLNEGTLFKTGLNVCPLNAKVHYNLAKNGADMGDRELAIKEYRRALHLHPKYDQAMNNLANILKDKGEVPEAENLLLRATQLRPDFAAAWMNLGIVQVNLGKLVEAEVSYMTALRHRRKYPDCYYNLGNLYLEQKRYQEAYQAWRNATLQQPTHIVAWNNMIIMLDSIGDLELAENMALEALHILPDEASLHFNMANTLGKAKRYDQSEHHFKAALRISPDNPSYHANLGVLYHRWEKFSLAEKRYLHALTLKPDLKSARDNLELLRRTSSAAR